MGELEVRVSVRGGGQRFPNPLLHTHAHTFCTPRRRPPRRRRRHAARAPYSPTPTRSPANVELKSEIPPRVFSPEIPTRFTNTPTS